jgi:hypothetical protein
MQRVTLFVALAGLAAVACAGLVVCGHILMNRLDPFAAQQFDPTLWSAADCNGRAAMAGDAIRQPAGWAARGRCGGTLRRA